MATAEINSCMPSLVTGIKLKKATTEMLCLRSMLERCATCNPRKHPQAEQTSHWQVYDAMAFADASCTVNASAS